MGRSALQVGAWHWVKPGCSMMSGIGTNWAADGDWAAHYNTGTGGGGAGYQSVCQRPKPSNWEVTDGYCRVNGGGSTPSWAEDQTHTWYTNAGYSETLQKGFWFERGAYQWCGSLMGGGNRNLWDAEDKCKQICLEN